MDDYTKIEKEFGIYKNGKNNLKDKIKQLLQKKEEFEYRYNKLKDVNNNNFRKITQLTSLVNELISKGFENCSNCKNLYKNGCSTRDECNNYEATEEVQQHKDKLKEIINE
jgi:hypothetical protein